MNVEFGPSSGSAPAPVLEKKETHATPVSGVNVESTTTVAAPVPQVPAVASPSFLAPRGLVLGDKLPEFKEIIFPRVNIAQNIGQLKDTFQPGSLVYNQSALLFTPPIIDKTTGNVAKPGLPPVHLIVLGFRETRFVEKVKGGARGLIVDTEEQVRAAGGTTDYNEWKLKEASGIKRFEALAEAIVAIRRPDHCKDDKSVFVYDVDGHRYALGIWGLKGTAYTVAKTAFFTPRAMGCLQEGGYPSYVFAVTTKWKPFDGGNGAWIPVCIPVERTSEKALDFVRKVLTGQ
jgi:hypothetical protein